MTPQQITALIDGTWPAAAYANVGPWTIRQGDGGGSRVSAATATVPFDIDDGAITQAEDAMNAIGQTPLFMIRSGEDTLDALLEKRGYHIKDPVTLYAAPIDDIATQRPPPVTTFEVWPPLAAELEIWAEGGVGPSRVDVMHRAAGPKTTIFGRLDDTPAGCLFASMHDDIVTVHAVETATKFRRRGLGLHMVRAAAFWGRDNGATTFSLVTTVANGPANALYTSLGMSAVEGYHYRIHPEA